MDHIAFATLRSADEAWVGSLNYTKEVMQAEAGNISKLLNDLDKKHTAESKAIKDEIKE